MVRDEKYVIFETINSSANRTSNPVYFHFDRTITTRLHSNKFLRNFGREKSRTSLEFSRFVRVGVTREAKFFTKLYSRTTVMYRYRQDVRRYITYNLFARITTWNRRGVHVSKSWRVFSCHQTVCSASGAEPLRTFGTVFRWFGARRAINDRGYFTSLLRIYVFWTKTKSELAVTP